MQTATHFQAQVEFLQAKLTEKDQLLDVKNQQVERHQHTIEQKNRYILQLEEWIKQQRQQRFGTSSEKASPNQLGLFNEAEAIEQEAVETAVICNGLDLI